MEESVSLEYGVAPQEVGPRSPEELKSALERAWEEVERVRRARMRRYAIAAGFTSAGIFLLFLSLMMLLERLAIWPLGVASTYVALTSLGALSFGYGFYRMGAH